MKKITLCFALLTAFTTVQVNAAEGEISTQGVEDYAEEIEMFSDFYSYPANYIFENAQGDVINEYLLANEEAYKERPKQTTMKLMNDVVTVMDKRNTDGVTLTNRKSWKDLKVYYTPAEYVMHDFNAKIGIKESGKIVWASGEAVNLRRRMASSYLVEESHTIDAGRSTVTYNLKHQITYSFNHVTRYSKIIW